jgi:cell division protein FtsB
VNATLLVALAVATVGPLLTYLVASRKLSGKIGTSDAADLWSESRSIRDDYRDRLDQSNRRQAACEERIAKLESDKNALVGENMMLRGRIDVLEQENKRLRDHVEKLLKQLIHEEEE